MVNKNSFYEKVVLISAQSLLTTAATDSVAPVLAPGPTQNATTLIIKGAGVIMQNGSVVCLAQTCLIPPAMLASFNRAPNPFTGGRVINGLAPEQPVPASQLLVTVAAATKCGLQTFQYNGVLTYVDPNASLALLQLQWPVAPPTVPTIPPGFGPVPLPIAPPVLSNPILDFKCMGAHLSSRKLEVGEMVYVAGPLNGPLNNGGVPSYSLAEGKVINASYMDPAGWVLPPLALLSVPGVTTNYPGVPVFDCEGKLLGLIVQAPVGAVVAGGATNDLANRENQQSGLPNTPLAAGDGSLAMITLKTIRRFFKMTGGSYPAPPPASVSPPTGSYPPGTLPPPFSPFLQTITDVGMLGSGIPSTFQLILSGWAGIGYRQMQAEDYYDNIDFSGTVTGNPGSYYPNLTVGGVTPAPVSSFRPVGGILVTAVAGDPTSLPSHFVPGLSNAGQGPFAGTVNSPFLGILHPGDMVVGFQVSGGNPREIFAPGGGPGELAPYDWLARFAPGAQLSILYYSSSVTLPGPAMSGQKFPTLLSTPLATLPARPAVLAYPYFDYSRIPTITLAGITVGALPINNTVSIPVPAGIGAFEPSI